MIERHAVWIQTENLARKDTFLIVMVGDTHFAGFAADGPRGRRLPEPSDARVDSEQTKESARDRSGAETGVQDAEMVGDDRVARWVADVPGSGPPATSDDGVESAHVKEVLPTEDPVDRRSPGCFGWMVRWKRKRRTGKSMGTTA